MLIGHSAGAHLCALTTMFLIDARDELFIEVSNQRDITRAIRGVIGKDYCTLSHQDRVMVENIFNAEKTSTLVSVCVPRSF